MDFSEVGRYQLLTKLAEGGMSSVYLATDPVVDRRVVIKILTPEGDQDLGIQRFLREARALAYLSHPNIVKLFEAGTVEKHVYLVLEYMDGGSLEDKIIHASKFNTLVNSEFAIQAVLKVGRALSYAHTRAIVHRDVKPSNILLSSTGDVKISDFGLWLAPDDPSITITREVHGTPMYMSPEQIVGRPADPRTDIFALGLVLYELLCGRLPFDTVGVTWTLLFSIINADFPNPRRFNRAIPLPISEAIMKSLEKDPINRFQTMAEFMDAIDRGSRISLEKEKASNTGSVLLSKIQSFFKGSRQAPRPYRPATETIEAYGPVVTSFPPIEKMAFARLTVLSGPYQGHEYQLKETTFIGRDEFGPTQGDVLVSRKHAKIGFQDGQCYIEDLASLNGTLVNGIQLQPSQRQTLHNLDEIRIGSTIMIFSQILSADQSDNEGRARLREFDALWEGLIKAVK